MCWRERGGRKAHRAGRHRFVQQRRDALGLVGRCRALHRFLAHHEMAKRRERREKADVDSNAAALRRVHELGKAFPVPGDALAQRVEGNRLDVDQVPGRDLANLGLARRDADAAVAHHDRGHAVPRGAGEQRIPANLRVVVRMRIDEARRDDQFAGVDGALRAVADLADFRDRSILDRDIRANARSAGAVDHGAVFDYEIVCHWGSPSLARSEGLSSCIQRGPLRASRTIGPSLG